MQSEPHPHFHISSMGKLVTEAADLLKDAGAHNHTRLKDTVLSKVAADPEPFTSLPDAPSRSSGTQVSG
jgi:hypothetical protein